MTGGTIEATPAVISTLHDVGECAIELGSVLGWFKFIVTDVSHREIKLTGWIKAGGSPDSRRPPELADRALLRTRSRNGSPGWTRTNDRTVNNRALWRTSTRCSAIC